MYVDTMCLNNVDHNLMYPFHKRIALTHSAHHLHQQVPTSTSPRCLLQSRIRNPRSDAFVAILWTQTTRIWTSAQLKMTTLITLASKRIRYSRVLNVKTALFRCHPYRLGHGWSRHCCLDMSTNAVWIRPCRSPSLPYLDFLYIVN